MRRAVLVAVIVLVGAVLAPGTASADRTYHSPPIQLAPVDGTVGGRGQVENAHANGPQVYAHEQYQIFGADPGADYQVTLHVYAGDPTCSGAETFALGTAVLHTNVAGNAAGDHVFTPADAAGLPKNVPHGIVWTMSAGAHETYRSGCQVVVLD